MRPVTAAALAAALALGACGSDDDDDAASVDGAGTTDPATSGPAPGGAGETSMPAPGTDTDAPPSSEPGGDTSAVAGLWDATETSPDGLDDRFRPTEYVDIAGNGLWTAYGQDAAGANCFEIDGPYTLTLEVEATNEYSLSSEDEGLTLVAEGDVLSFRLGADGEVENWPRVQGTLASDLPICE